MLKKIMTFICFGSLCLGVVGFGGVGFDAGIGRLNAQDQNSENAEGSDHATGSHHPSHFNIPAPTLGGKQWWTDWVHKHGYRIQQNVATRHHRLLNPSNVRLAWGTRKACEAKLDQICEQQSLRSMKGRVVILLHGLTRSRTSMKPLADYIEENSNLQVINFGYASSRTEIAEHAQALASIIDNLPDVDEIHFVGHSMGNIVVRYYLGSITTKHDERLKRMVMLGPPNHGSRLANQFKNHLWFKAFWGTAGQQLSKDGWDETSKQLAVPPFEFGVIAGGKPDPHQGDSPLLENPLLENPLLENPLLENPLLEGANDLVVTVEETRLAGARDFIQLDLWHSTIMQNDDVMKATLRFLEKGFFVSESMRQPILGQR